MTKVASLEQFEDTLSGGLLSLKLSLSKNEVECLYQHYVLLDKWSRVHNLTTIRSMTDIVYRHYIDCLVGLSFLSAEEEVFDFGSGAGFPGLVAAVLWKESKIQLVEASRKKCSFLRVAIAQLGLGNVEVKQDRVEKISGVKFGITRATFSAPFVRIAACALAENGKLALWAGESTPGELQRVLMECGVRMLEEFSYRWEGIRPRRVLLVQRER